MEKKPMEKEQTFYLEGMPLQVRFSYDESAGKYIAELPDFEESPVYTGAGHLCVTAVQDACGYGEAAPDITGRCLDCGSCRFYDPATPGRLVGMCMQENNRKTREDLSGKASGIKEPRSEEND